jgi:hypothetical protein
MRSKSMTPPLEAAMKAGSFKTKREAVEAGRSKTFAACRPGNTE